MERKKKTTFVRILKSLNLPGLRNSHLSAVLAVTINIAPLDHQYHPKKQWLSDLNQIPVRCMYNVHCTGWTTSYCILLELLSLNKCMQKDLSSHSYSELTRLKMTPDRYILICPFILFFFFMLVIYNNKNQVIKVSWTFLILFNKIIRSGFSNYI